MPRDILSISIAVRSPAPAIDGIANKNENLAASSADRPIIKPVQIVAPERDIPGMIANAWAKPMLNPFTKVKFDFLFKNHFEIISIIPVQSMPVLQNVHYQTLKKLDLLMIILLL